MDLPLPVLPDLNRLALVVIDVQRGFDNTASWGQRDDPACEDNIASLLAACHDTRPLEPHLASRPGAIQVVTFAIHLSASGIRARLTSVLSTAFCQPLGLTKDNETYALQATLGRRGREEGALRADLDPYGPPSRSSRSDDQARVAPGDCWLVVPSSGSVPHKVAVRA